MTTTMTIEGLVAAVGGYSTAPPADVDLSGFCPEDVEFVVGPRMAGGWLVEDGRLSRFYGDDGADVTARVARSRTVDHVDPWYAAERVMWPDPDGQVAAYVNNRAQENSISWHADPADAIRAALAAEI